MKIFKKAFLLFIASTILLVNPATSAFAAKPREDKITVDKIFPLYNDTEEIVAYYASLSNGGYVVTNSDGTDFIEYSLIDVNVDLNYNKKHYYTRPHFIYEEENSTKIRNIYTNSTYSSSYLDNQEFCIEPEGGKNAPQVQVVVDQIITNADIIKEQKALKYPTMPYCYNPDGRCGAVAAAILLRYYDDYVNDSFVLSAHETSDGKDLIALLTTMYVGTSSGYSTMKSGVNTYLSARKVSYRLHSLLVSNTSSSTVFNKIKSYIANNKPLILGLADHPILGDHWVVGTGYAITYSEKKGISEVVIINDGHGNTQVRINCNYIDGCLYLS